MAAYRFTVPGQPQPKERPRLGAGGRVYTPGATAKYEEKVQLLAKGAGMRQQHAFAGPVKLVVKAFSGDARRVDLDNIIKSCSDALNGLAWKDDSQIAVLLASKAVDRKNPRVELVVEELPPEEAPR